MVANFCPSCGKPAGEQGKFCRFCGFPLEAAPVPTLNELQQARLDSEMRAAAMASPRRAGRYDPEPTSIGRHIFNVAAIVVVLLLCGWFALWLFSAGSASDSTAAASSRPAGFTEQIGSPDIAVAAFHYAYIPFTVRSIPFLTARLTGSFQATGGMNDIEVYVMDADGFTNYSNGHQFNSYYTSGKVTVDHPNVGPLAPGNYYLVFSNTFSIVTSKAVVNRLAISYSPL